MKLIRVFAIVAVAAGLAALGSLAQWGVRPDLLSCQDGRIHTAAGSIGVFGTTCTGGPFAS